MNCNRYLGFFKRKEVINHLLSFFFLILLLTLKYQ
nr:MAG TPA: hypothetical protein [Caudoviricetes sp.]